MEFDSATPPAEWALAAVGAVLACAVIGLLLFQALTGSDRPPLLSTRVTQIRSAPGGHMVGVEIRNAGSNAASNVQVDGRLLINGELVEEAGAQVDYVPADATRTFTLVFSRNPAEGRLEISPTGFAEQ